jgi:FO synthase subunit 2
VRAEVTAALGRALDGEDLDGDALVALYDAAMADAVARSALVATADALRRRQVGDVVTWVVNRNINFTNVCVKSCRFCAFSRDFRSEAGYMLPPAEIARRAEEAAAYGATEVCLQAGLAPGVSASLYTDVLVAVKERVPSMHVHAYSPEEIKYVARLAGQTVPEVLRDLKAAGLGSLPGTSAEILDDALRRQLAPGRITVAEWTHVLRSAHELGIPTTSTMMFGHLDRPVHVARHLLHVRALQRETGGITEFVPLSFVHEEAPRLASRPGVRPGPSREEVVVVHALSRVALGNDVPNLQVSWVKEGLAAAGELLGAGVNDLGGTLMNESISTQAGAAYGQIATPAALRAIARAAGRQPAQRDTRYRLLRVYEDDDGPEPLDGLTDPEAVFGSYGALAADPAFRFSP